MIAKPKTRAKSIKVKNLSRKEGLKFFNEQAQHYLDIDGKEFIRRWDLGLFNGKLDSPAVVHLSVLLPFAR